MTSHDERHALLDQLDLLRTRRAEMEAGSAVDDHPADMGEQAGMTRRREELDWIEREIRDITHLLHLAAERDDVQPERVDVGTLVTLLHPDGGLESLAFTPVPDEGFPTVTPDSPLGHSLLGAAVGDEIGWDTPAGRRHARVEDIRADLGGER